MAARDPEVRALSSTIAATERHHPDADTSDLRRQLRAAQAADYIRRSVDADPPFTPAELDSLSKIFRDHRQVRRDGVA